MSDLKGPAKKVVIRVMLNALEVQYPAALVNYFERFIDEMQKFCQK